MLFCYHIIKRKGAKILDDLWLIYDSYYEFGDDNVHTFMFETCLRFGIDAELKYDGKFEFFYNRLYYDKKEIKNLPKICFFRCQNYELGYSLEKIGIKVVNKPKVIENVRDKLFVHNLMQKNKIRQPRTIFLADQDFCQIEKSLNLPFVLKDNFGKQGKGVFLIKNEKMFDNKVKLLKKEGKCSIICQEYIEASFGQDIRFYIVGGKVCAVGKRVNKKDFRSNLALGGKGETYTPTKKELNLAQKIAKLLNLEVGSVDFMLDGEKLVFCEANSSAGFRMFVDLNIPINDYIAQYLKSIL